MDAQLQKSTFFIVMLGPLVVACLFFLVSLYFGTRMLLNLREDHEILAAVSAPFALFSERFYTAKGKLFYERFQKFFRLFAIWLLGWGLLMLTIHGLGKLLG